MCVKNSFAYQISAAVEQFFFFFLSTSMCVLLAGTQTKNTFSECVTNKKTDGDCDEHDVFQDSSLSDGRHHFLLIGFIIDSLLDKMRDQNQSQCENLTKHQRNQTEGRIESDLSLELEHEHQFAHKGN